MGDFKVRLDCYSPTPPVSQWGECVLLVVVWVIHKQQIARLTLKKVAQRFDCLTTDTRFAVDHSRQRFACYARLLGQFLKRQLVLLRAVLYVVFSYQNRQPISQLAHLLMLLCSIREAVTKVKHFDGFMLTQCAFSVTMMSVAQRSKEIILVSAL